MAWRIVFVPSSRFALVALAGTSGQAAEATQRQWNEAFAEGPGRRKFQMLAEDLLEAGVLLYLQSPGLAGGE